MAKPIGFLGGILAILGIVLSLFLPIFTWLDITLTKDPFIGDTETFKILFNGMMGYSNSDNGDSLAYASKLAFILPGLIVFFGSILAFTGKKDFVLMGGLLILVGTLFWIADMVVVMPTYFASLGYASFDITFMDLFSGSNSWDYLVTTHTIDWKLGLGCYLTIAGGALAFIGAFPGED